MTTTVVAELMSIPISIEVLLFSVLLYAIFRLLRRLEVNSSLNNIPGPRSKSILTGHILELFHTDAWEFHTKISEKYGGIVKVKALFGENQLYVFDPKALHHILVKDQYIFEETDRFLDLNYLMFGDGLLSTAGERHRKQRKMLNPVFSIAHMKKLVPVFLRISQKLRETFASKLKDGPREIDLTEWMTRTALELIGQSGLGYSFDSLTEDHVPHPFSIASKQLVPLIQTPALFLMSTYVLPTARKVGSSQFRRWVVDTIPWKSMHQLRDIINILYNTSVEILESKKRALEEGDEAVSKQIAQGNDIMSILMRENLVSTDDAQLSDSEILGQMTTLTFAATDTTSGALSRILYLLSIYKDVQKTLREEIKEARKLHGDLTYENLMTLPYLDAVCRETLRLHPPIPFILRIARQDSVLPLLSPIKDADGREIHEIMVPTNTTILVSMISANRNPEIWGPDSYEWKPERWLSPLPASVSEAHIPGIYSHLMTFISGARACIGFKFSELEMKTVLFTLLESFDFSPGKQEIVWNMNAITSPNVAGADPTLASLPMLVSSL